MFAVECYAAVRRVVFVEGHSRRGAARVFGLAGETDVALALSLAACQKGFTVAFKTAAAIVNQLLEARDERCLLKMQRDLAAVKLLIIDELGYVPLSRTARSERGTMHHQKSWGFARCAEEDTAGPDFFASEVARGLSANLRAPHFKEPASSRA